ncbi:phage holin family protein [Lentibacillus halophilus]|uniref:Phage holin family protein n=1 Tax=Lentibacillus halophilus TaxID=295065 RepID=A0ABN0ZG23_9BACI
MLMRWAISVVLNAIALTAAAWLFTGFYLEGFGTALLASVILGILNTIVRPILVILTMPITLLSLGLFLFVVNAVTLMITQGVMDESFSIAGFGTAVMAAVILAIINMILSRLVKDRLT